MLSHKLQRLARFLDLVLEGKIQPARKSLVLARAMALDCHAQASHMEQVPVVLPRRVKLKGLAAMAAVPVLVPQNDNFDFDQRDPYGFA